MSLLLTWALILGAVPLVLTLVLRGLISFEAGVVALFGVALVAGIGWRAVRLLLTLVSVGLFVMQFAGPGTPGSTLVFELGVISLVLLGVAMIFGAPFRSR